MYDYKLQSLIIVLATRLIIVIYGYCRIVQAYSTNLLHILFVGSYGNCYYIYAYCLYDISMN